MKKSTSQFGFMLVELFVTISIFTILTGIVLSNYRSYDSNALLANASEDIVLALRQAQVYGVGVRGVTTGAGTSFDSPYGVLFELGNQIVVFADVDNDSTYEPLDGEMVETIVWKSPISITEITCDGVSCTTPLVIRFIRPIPDAMISDGTANSFNEATIEVWNGVVGAGSKSSTITISSAGQISVQ